MEFTYSELTEDDLLAVEKAEKEHLKKRKRDEPQCDAIEIYCDGSCLKNPGPGGWAAIVYYKHSDAILERKSMKGGEKQTTNNRMELMAAIQGLSSIDAKEIPTVISTDSEYLKEGITNYIRTWKKNGWRTAAKQPVKNQDLWLKLDTIVSSRIVQWQWVKAHAGHPENEQVDKMAREQAKMMAG